VKGLFVRMKVMNLFLVVVVLLFVFVAAEINDTDVSLENETVVVNEVASDLVVDEHDFGEVGVDDMVIEIEENAEEENSPFDMVFSYVSDVIDKVNAVHQNLFYVIIIVLWVLLLFLHSIFLVISLLMLVLLGLLCFIERRSERM